MYKSMNIPDDQMIVSLEALLKSALCRMAGNSHKLFY